jgi:CDP-diacylglycerol--serine O-phosphatidyltransferase
VETTGGATPTGDEPAAGHRSRRQEFREKLSEIRERQEQRHRVPPVYVIPNLITSASLFSALMAIISTYHGDWVQACYLVLLSAVLDGLDGPVARWTRTTSSFGLQFDSLADVVAFGVAPAFLMYAKLEGIDASTQLPPWAPRMAMGICALYAVCGALRLARFNIQVSTEEKRHFTGLPIPAAAGVVVSAFLVVEQYFPELYMVEIDLGRSLHRAILLLMLIVSYLMVSTTPFPAPKTLMRNMRRSMQGLVTILFAFCLLIMFKTHLPLIAHLGFMTYLIGSLVAVVRAKRRIASYSPGVPVSGEHPLP